jgi:hypothetical protein
MLLAGPLCLIGVCLCALCVRNLRVTRCCGDFHERSHCCQLESESWMIVSRCARQNIFMFRIFTDGETKPIINIGDVYRINTDIVVAFWVESTCDDTLELSLQSSMAGCRFQTDNENLRGLVLQPGKMYSFQSELFNQVRPLCEVEVRLRDSSADLQHNRHDKVVRTGSTREENVGRMLRATGSSSSSNSSSSNV